MEVPAGVALAPIPEYSLYGAKSLAQNLSIAATQAQIGESSQEGVPTLGEEFPDTWRDYGTIESAFATVDRFQRSTALYEAKQGPWAIIQGMKAIGAASILRHARQNTPAVLYEMYPDAQFAETQYWMATRNTVIGTIALRGIERAVSIAAIVSTVIGYGLIVPTDKNKMHSYYEAGYSPIEAPVVIPKSHPDGDTTLPERRLWIKEF